MPKRSLLYIPQSPVARDKKEELKREQLKRKPISVYQPALVKKVEPHKSDKTMVYVNLTVQKPEPRNRERQKNIEANLPKRVNATISADTKTKEERELRQNIIKEQTQNPVTNILKTPIAMLYNPFGIAGELLSYSDNKKMQEWSDKLGTVSGQVNYWNQQKAKGILTNNEELKKKGLNDALFTAGAYIGGEALPGIVEGVKLLYKAQPYRLFPKPNPNSYYRNIGDVDGYLDAVNTGEIKGKFMGAPYFGDKGYFVSQVKLNGKTPRGKYTSPLQDGAGYKGKYMVEANGDKIKFSNNYDWGNIPIKENSTPDMKGIDRFKRSISINDINLWERVLTIGDKEILHKKIPIKMGADINILKNSTSNPISNDLLKEINYKFSRLVNDGKGVNNFGLFELNSGDIALVKQPKEFGSAPIKNILNANKQGAKLVPILKESLIKDAKTNKYYMIQIQPKAKGQSVYDIIKNKKELDVSQKHLDELFETVKIAQQNGIGLDIRGFPKTNNVFYDKDYGFSIIDLQHPENISSTRDPLYYLRDIVNGYSKTFFKGKNYNHLKLPKDRPDQYNLKW